MDNKDKIITFLIAKRGVQHNGDTDFFDTFDGAVNFKNNANVVVLEDANALKLVLADFSNNIEFRLLIHANIGEAGKESQTKKLQTVVADIRSIPGCAHINPFFVTRSGEIERLCADQNKKFVKLKGSNIMCTYTSLLSSDEDFLKELKPFSKKTSTNGICNSDKPKIFIGSSTNGLSYATAVKSVIEKKKLKIDVDIWDNVFGDDNDVNIEVLEKAIEKYKYSIFIFSPDDTIKMSNDNEEKKIPRDNVIFEYGLFMGKNGRHNTFFIVPQEWKGLRIITDIDGMNRFPYTENENKDSAVRSSCDKILEVIQKDKTSYL
ncbi:TIR domain-containing protein [Bacteroides sp.]|uniref:TIR domain-containing protein n=1 Tax=Bacteroides sp. TaxID=29523 RepID=UPI002630F4C8|nr:TIR domain-containing protein [Bacteroides sp.]MDD3038988.1 nucleotide-binding protein [Bacteroides sp.]